MSESPKPVEPVHEAVDDGHAKPSWLERLGALLMREPEDREQLVELLRSAFARQLIDSSESPDKFIPLVIETNHSRFPVIESSKDQVIGILLAKDLLRYYAGEEEFNVRD